MTDIETTLARLSKKSIILITLIGIFIIVLVLPGSYMIPVIGATPDDWNQNTFWYEPWGKSGVHKGIDIFAEKSTQVISPTAGIVVYTGEIELGGKVILTLGAGWHLHYFAHLNEINIHTGDFLAQGEAIASVGDSGNAMGKQPHLHYSLVTIFPHLWKIDNSTQGWKKMFYLNPLEYLE